MAVILNARSLHKSFGAVIAASEVNAAIEKDSVVGLIGTNGAGKTTFINMITGYIKPDQGTFDFAIMYVPAENVYYEIIVQSADEDEAIATYALERRVIPVSPNCFYAYLQVIVLGLRGLDIEASARAIQDNLGRLGGDLARVQEHMTKLGTHLGNAQKQFAEADRSLARFESKLEAIGDGREDADGQRSLLPP